MTNHINSRTMAVAPKGRNGRRTKMVPSAVALAFSIQLSIVAAATLDPRDLTDPPAQPSSATELRLETYTPPAYSATPQPPVPIQVKAVPFTPIPLAPPPTVSNPGTSGGVAVPIADPLPRGAGPAQRGR